MSGNVPYAIQAEGVSAGVLHDLELHVPWGSLYGLIGPNGAGKSLLLRVVAGCQRLTAGAVRVADRPPGHAESIGYLPQIYGLYDELTPAEYLELAAAGYGLPGARRRQVGAELLELVGLQDRAHDPIAALSPGLRQRLALARSLCHDPPILLLDEPAARLDPPAQLELREILRELHAMGKTILLSSPTLPELTELCTEIGVMGRGRLLAEGPAAAVRDSLAVPRLYLQLTDPAQLPRAAEILAEQGVAEFEGDETLWLEYPGGQQALPALLARLLAADLPLTRFELAPAPWEEIMATLEGEA